MKKILLALVVTLGLAVAVPFGAAAPVSAATAKVDAYGIVTINGTTAKGAKVIVTCNGHAKKDTTDNGGNYFVQFKATDCPPGSTFTVTAKKGNKGGTTVSTMNQDGSTEADVNVSTASVPEFGTVAGISTAIAAGGGLLVMRRRQLAQQA